MRLTRAAGGRRGFLLGLALIGAVFLAVLASRISLPSFGSYHDDALYFASAKALAAGDGFRAPSLPDAPPQTKYPILYPLALSLVWRVEPSFPDNLPLAYALNALFGLALILAAAAVLRQTGAGRAETLLLTALFALHPHTLYWSGALLSEALFGALALGALVAGRSAFGAEEKFSVRRWSLAVALLWAATLTRTVGVAFVAGLVVWALRRRRRWAAAGAATAFAPLAIGLARSWSGATARIPPGLEQALAYYTSYWRFWRLSVPDVETFAAQTSFLLAETLEHPALAVFGLPAGALAPAWLQMLAVTLSAGVAAGVVTRIRRHGVHPVYFAGAFYLPITLLWNYPLLTRFWLPFLPLLLAGAAAELSRLARAAARGWRTGPAGSRAAAAGFAVALAALIGFAVYRHAVATPALFAREARRRAEFGPEKREAYDWLRLHADAACAAAAPLVVSYEDPVLYLSTGLRGMRPIVFSTGWSFRQDAAGLERELDGVGQAAEALEACYWLVSGDDFAVETAPEKARAATTKFLDDREPVFVSSQGRVRIYRLRAKEPMQVSQDKPLY